MDENKLYDINYNKSYYVVSANDLIRGKQKMSLMESKLLYIAISQVVKQDTDFKTYSTTITELAKFMKVDSTNLYRNIKEICSSLMQRIIKIEVSKNEWKIFQWVSRAEYSNGTLTLRLSDDIKPYLLELEKHYSQYLLGTLLEFTSFYASRVYQLMVCELQGRDEIELDMTIDELREFFQTEKKYAQPRDLIKKTLDIAKNEINDNRNDCIIYFEYRINKQPTKGHPIDTVTFIAYRKNLENSNVLKQIIK